MKVLYIQYTNPAFYPPLEHSSRILAGAGWQVRFLGIHSDCESRPELVAHANIDVRLMGPCRAGWRQKLHYAVFSAWAIVTAIFWRPRWVYASDTLSCPVALFLSALPGIGLIYHEHDSPDASRANQGLFQRAILRSRSRLSARAALCILPNQLRLERFCRANAGVRRACSVWNCPSRLEIAAVRPGAPAGDLWLLYHGSLSPARLPQTVLHALCLLPENVKLRVVGYETSGFPAFLKNFADRARELGVLSRVEIAGFVTRPQLLDLCRNSHVGLALMPTCSTDPNEQTMSGASNKAFEYLASGLAVLVSDLPDWNSLYVEAGYGLSCIPEDPGSIAAAIRWFLDHPGETFRMGEQGRARALSEWNYESQFAPVLRLLEGNETGLPAIAHSCGELRRTNS